MSRQKHYDHPIKVVWPKGGKKTTQLSGTEIGSVPSNDYWNVPNWTDKNTYPDHKKTIPAEWAWEFYRRSARARHEWLAKAGWDPRGAMPEKWGFTQDYKPAIYLGPVSVQVEFPMAAIVVDLTLPLEGQTYSAIQDLKRTPPLRRLAKANAQYPIRHREFATYLRVLDAYDSGTSLAAVHQVMRLDAKTARRYLQSATTWAERDWIYLLRPAGRKPRNHK